MNIYEDVIYPVIDEIKENFEQLSDFNKSPETVIVGPDTVLDSVAMLQFIIGVEAKLEEKTGLSVSLVTVDNLTAEESELSTVETLVKHIEKLLAKENEVVK